MCTVIVSVCLQVSGIKDSQNFIPILQNPVLTCVKMLVTISVCVNVFTHHLVLHKLPWVALGHCHCPAFLHSWWLHIPCGTDHVLYCVFYVYCSCSVSTCFDMSTCIEMEDFLKAIVEDGMVHVYIMHSIHLPFLKCCIYVYFSFLFFVFMLFSCSNLFCLYVPLQELPSTTTTTTISTMKVLDLIFVALHLPSRCFICFLSQTNSLRRHRWSEKTVCDL